MKKIVMSLCALVIFSACQSPKGEDQNENDASASETSEATSPNELTEAQRQEGWKLLFNGENMEGWKTFKDKENNSWEVVDGTLHCKPKGAAEKRADIMTEEQFGDFELVFDWKIAPGDNSGVIYRATEEFERPYESGPEYQVIDDKGYSGGLSDTQTSGSNYDVHAAPADKPVNPPGDWNTGRIIAKGNHVEHWLNGAKVVEYELNSPDWIERKNGSKWKDVKGYGQATKGHIDLQDHGGEVWYRNIMIKTL